MLSRDRHGTNCKPLLLFEMYVYRCTKFFVFPTQWTQNVIKRNDSKEIQGKKLRTWGCYTIWYDMIWYDMIWYDMIWCDMMWYGMLWYDMRRCDMIWYDIYWLQLGFHQFTVVGKFVQKWERESYIQKEMQYTTQYQNTEYSKWKTTFKTRKQT